MKEFLLTLSIVMIGLGISKLLKAFVLYLYSRGGTNEKN